jgi:hypothetical protein
LKNTPTTRPAYGCSQINAVNTCFYFLLPWW